MRRGDQAHVDLDRTRTAEPHERTLFKHTQKLGLHARRHGGDLVEEERAAMSAFEQSFLASTRIREGARLESEQLAFEQRVGQRGAVDCRLRRPCAQLRAPGTAAFALAARCSVFQSSRIDLPRPIAPAHTKTGEQREPRLARRQDADQFFTKQQRAARQVPSTAGLRLIS